MSSSSNSSNGCRSNSDSSSSSTCSISSSSRSSISSGYSDASESSLTPLSLHRSGHKPSVTKGTQGVVTVQNDKFTLTKDDWDCRVDPGTRGKDLVVQVCRGRGWRGLGVR